MSDDASPVTLLEAPMHIGRTHLRYLVVASVLIAILLILIYWTPPKLDTDAVRDIVENAGYWGPLFIMGLMILAVVASPLPSAPIALAAGAAYGHTFGTLYVIAGAEVGALIAFLIARLVGRDVLKRWFGSKIDAGMLGSQNALTAIVFLSRLMPFVSFDLISYAAGLSGLRLWRFGIATLAGIVPASFLLAHFGVEAVEGNSSVATGIAAVLGLATVLTAGWALTRRLRKEPDD